MRYIGNKTRLLPFILRTLKRSGIGVGSVHDAFAGTASVSRALKEKGWRVHSSDLLMSSYVFQRAYVVAEDADPLLGDMARDLSALPPRRAFISEHFSPSDRRGAGTRMYFTPENAGRIDAAREELEQWRKAGRIDETNYYLLLAAIIEGADRVANTAGVYASYDEVARGRIGIGASAFGADHKIVGGFVFILAARRAGKERERHRAGCLGRQVE